MPDRADGPSAPAPEPPLRAPRPGALEVAGILVICALLLVGLARMDNEAAREEAARALRAQQEQRARAPQDVRPSRREIAAASGGISQTGRSLPPVPAPRAVTTAEASRAPDLLLFAATGVGILMCAGGLSLLLRGR